MTMTTIWMKKHLERVALQPLRLPSSLTLKWKKEQ
jgi:hypothetical protein